MLVVFVDHVQKKLESLQRCQSLEEVCLQTIHLTHLWLQNITQALSVFLLSSRINPLAFYHERRPLIDYATHHLFCCA